MNTFEELSGEAENEIFPEDASFVSIEDALRAETADEANNYA